MIRYFEELIFEAIVKSSKTVKFKIFPLYGFLEIHTMTVLLTLDIHYVVVTKKHKKLLSCYSSHIIDTDTGHLYHINFSSMM